MTPLERLTAALEAKGGRGHGRDWQCPAHEDSRASLSIGEGQDGKALLRCWAGCTLEAIVSELELTLEDLFPAREEIRKGRGTPPWKRPIRATFDYRNAAGDLLSQVVRFDDDDARLEKCRPRFPDPGKRDGWTWTKRKTERPLYRLLELLEAVKTGEMIVIPEGERDVETLRAHGFEATTNPGGAEGWRTEYAETFREANVVILPDNDAAGVKHAETVARSLRGIAARVRVLALPDLPPKGDVSDWFTAGGTAERFMELAKETPDWTPPLPAGAPSDGEKMPWPEAPPDEAYGNVSGPPARDSAAAVLVEIGVRSSHLFHDDRETAFAAIGPADARRIVPVKSGTFSQFLGGLYYRERAKAANGEALASAKNVLGFKALFEGQRHTLHNRFALYEGALWVDLADARQRAARVTADGWTIESPPILFRRFAAQAPLPEPDASGDVRRFLEFLNLRDERDGLLSLSWLVTAVLGQIPRPILDLHGSQGSAKTTGGKMFRALTDPSAAASNRLSAHDDELALTLESNAVPLFDNVTSIPSRAAELLCQATTGGGFSKRELFTDSGEIVYSFRRAMIITGINIPTHAPDLLDRCLLVQLERIPRAKRRPEATIWREFDAAVPSLFGGLLNALSGAMKVHAETLARVTTLERMADFTLWGASVSEALGFGREAFLSAYRANVGRQTEEILEADPVARAVREQATRGPWEGTPSELFKLFRDRHGDEAKTDGWPKRADGLSRRLRTLEATLADSGVAVRFGRESGGKRVRKITIIMQAEAMSEAPDYVAPENSRNLASLVSPVSLTLPDPAVDEGPDASRPGTPRDATPGLASRPDPATEAGSGHRDARDGILRSGTGARKVVNL